MVLVNSDNPHLQNPACYSCVPSILQVSGRGPKNADGSSEGFEGVCGVITVDPCNDFYHRVNDAPVEI